MLSDMMLSSTPIVNTAITSTTPNTVPGATTTRLEPTKTIIDSDTTMANGQSGLPSPPASDTAKDPKLASETAFAHLIDLVDGDDLNADMIWRLGLERSAELLEMSLMAVYRWNGPEEDADTYHKPSPNVLDKCMDALAAMVKKSKYMKAGFAKRRTNADSDALPSAQLVDSQSVTAVALSSHTDMEPETDTPRQSTDVDGPHYLSEIHHSMIADTDAADEAGKSNDDDQNQRTSAIADKRETVRVKTTKETSNGSIKQNAKAAGLSTKSNPTAYAREEREWLWEQIKHYMSTRGPLQRKKIAEDFNEKFAGEVLPGYEASPIEHLREPRPGRKQGAIESEMNRMMVHPDYAAKYQALKKNKAEKQGKVSKGARKARPTKPVSERPQASASETVPMVAAEDTDDSASSDEIIVVVSSATRKRKREPVSPESELSDLEELSKRVKLIAEV